MNDFKGFDENFSLRGKNAIITGAAKGIGLEIAKMFSRKGANIIAFDKVDDLSFLENYVTKRGCKFLGFSGNVKDKKAF